MKQSFPVNFGHERCPLLGLHKDPQTAMAYPSAWNWCHGAEPSAPVSVSRQISVCLQSNHEQCQVFLSAKTAELPMEFRGTHIISNQKISRAWYLVVLFLLIVVSMFWVVHRYEPAQPPEGDNLLPLAVVVSPAFTVTFPKPEQTLVEMQLETPSRSLNPIGDTCGHALGIPFASRPQFVIHIVKSGESINGYAEDYRTTADTILSINHEIRIPIWENTPIVIPIATTLSVGIPSFDVYEIPETKITLVELAQILETDPLLFRKHNGFDDTCEVFSGWLLIPRENKTP